MSDELLREAIRCLLHETGDVILTDPDTWEPYPITRGLVHLWHVTQAENLPAIYEEGLIAGASSMTFGGPPAPVVYFLDDPSGARIMADKFAFNGIKPAVLYFRIPARLLQEYEPKLDPEEEFGGHSVAFVPSKGFTMKAIVTVYVDEPTDVPRHWTRRVRPLSEL